MDLGRKSLRHLGNIGKMFGTVLDAELPAAPADEVRDAFEVSEATEDLDRELALIRPGASPEKVLNAFVPFFEGGVCLRVVDSEENAAGASTAGASTLMTSLFLFGQTFTPPEPHGTPVDFGLTSVEITRVYKTALAPILKALSLGTFFRLDDASAFAFAVSRDVIFVLFDNRPHPWQVFAVENAYLAARDTFARLATPKPSVMSARGFFK